MLKLFKNKNNVIEKIQKKEFKVGTGPKYVTIDITNKCNLNCIACWTYSPLLKEKKPMQSWFKQELSYEKIKQLVHDLKRLKTKEIRLTGGGEPFIHPEIINIIKLIKKQNITLDITTNFTLINKNKIDTIIKNEVNNLTISLWAANAKTYKKTHPNQSEKTFERIKDNLKYLKSINKKTKIVFANVICNLNYSEIEDMIIFADKFGANEVYFTLVDPIKGKTESLLLNKKQQKSLQKKFERIIEKYNNNEYGNVRIDNPKNFIRRIKNKDMHKGNYDSNIVFKVPCTIGYTFSRIMANGDVAPCCRAVMVPTGNINKTSFKEIWDSYKQQRFREIGLNLKEHPKFFEKVGCITSCDNTMQNIETYNLLTSMKRQRKK